MSSAVVETALGLCLVFYLTALFTAGAVEWSAALINKRAKALLVGLQELLNPSAGARGTANPLKQLVSVARASLSVGYLDRAARGVAGEPPKALSWLRTTVGWSPPETGRITVTQLMQHSLIQPLKKVRLGTGKTRNPSYIPADVFAKALLDKAGQAGLAGAAAGTPANLLVGLLAASGGDTSLDEALRALAKAANNDADALLKGIESWYNAQMDRVTGAYKRWAKRLGVVVAVVVVGVLHIDALAIATSLWSDGALRASVVAAADVATACEQPAQGEGAKTPAECALAELDSWGLAGLPIGVQQWKPEALPKNGESWALLALGLGISVVATSMGAPFWFATVNKLVNIRNAGTPPKEES